MRDPLPPRKYAEQVLGKAATPEQLDELFELHATAHPVVRHIRGCMVDIAAESQATFRETTIVEILSIRPDSPGSVRSLVEGIAICNPGDDNNRRLGVTIAFGRALKHLGTKVHG